MHLNNQHVYPLERVSPELKGYYLNSNLEFFSAQHGQIRLMKPKTPPREFHVPEFIFNKQKYSASMVASVIKAATSSSDWEREITPPNAERAKPSFNKGSVILAVEKDGKLLFGTNPKVHAAEESYKKEMVRVARLNPGSKVVAVRIVATCSSKQVVKEEVKWDE